MILVISEDRDFAAVLAEQVSRELKLACETVAAEKDAAALADKAQLALFTGAPPALGLPAIDCTKRPLRLSGLLSDIRRLLQSGAEEDRQLGKDCLLSVRNRQLAHMLSGKTADLTDKEARLLAVLHEAGAAGIDKEELLKTVWGFDGDINTHTLQTHIYRLRGKLRELRAGEMIEMTGGRYRLAV